MSNFRKKFITVLTVLLCAMLTLSTALYISKNKTAEAYSSAQDVNVGEGDLFDTANQRFNYDNLQKLYSAILGGTNKTFTEVENAATNGNSTITSRNVIVEFGGMRWLAVYLSKAKQNLGGVAPDNSKAGYANDDDVVLTLWCSYTTKTGVWNKGLSTAQTNIKYPSSLYSTSYMRSVVLNNGGDYWKTVNSLYTSSELGYEGGQNGSNDYARFTMTNPNNGVSVMDYIVAPRYIDWQYEQHATSSSAAGFTSDLSNDAWGKITPQHLDNENVWYQDKYSDYYSDWKDDLVWLPSLAEVGVYNASGGIWNTTQAQRQNPTGTNAWLRSAGQNNIQNCYRISTDGNSQTPGGVDTANLVRPAIHLNLTKADKNARSIIFGTSDTKLSPDNDTEIALLEHEYNGENAEIIIPDYVDRLDIGVPTNGSYYDPSNGKFTAMDTTFKDGAYETGKYEITVTPKGVYQWSDGSTDLRKYAIHIKPTTLTVSNMANPLRGVSVSGSLLQSGYTVSSNKLGTNISPTLKYYKVEPKDYATATRPSDEQFIEDDGTFTASTEGTYRVYYNVEVAHHTIFRGQYDVIVSGTDWANLVANGTIGSGSAAYGASDAQLLENKEELKAALKDKIKIQKEGVDYDTTRFETVWNKLEAVVCTKDDTTYTEAVKNGGGHYNVGTYYIDLCYEQSADKSVTLSWLGELPSFEITRPTTAIVVKVVAKGDGSLTSEYGDPLAAMEIVISNSTFLAYGETVGDLPFGKFIMQDDYGNAVTDPPVGDYVVVADISEIVNYTIKFDTSESEYKITPRSVTLKVSDDTVVYGTDLGNYKFKSTLANGSTLAYDDILFELLTKDNTTYSLYLDNKEVTLSNDVTVGKYEIRVAVTTDNYVFDYIYGTLTINKADFDISGVKLENAGIVYDGKPHEAAVSGTLPEGVSVSYEYYLNGEKLDGVPTGIGLYTVYAKFTHDNENYNEIGDKVAYLKIASSQAELDKGFPDEAPDPDGNNGGETPDTNPSPAPGVDLENKKNEAKDALDKAAQEKKDEIDNNPNLTDEEKQAAKSEVDKELAKGNAAIDSATTTDGVNAAYNECKTNIENIKAEHEGSFPWWIIAVIVGVLAILGVIIIVVLKRRNSGDDEYDDYYGDEYGFDEDDFDEEDYGDDFE